MTVKIEIQLDLKKFDKSITEMSLASQKEAKKAIYLVSQKVEGDAKFNIQSGSRSGRVYKRGKSGRTHIASAPGEFPKTDYGALVSSITAEYAFNKLSSTVGSRLSAPHGHWLEFGTSKTKARPWLQPTIDSNKKYIQDKFDKAIVEISKEFKK